MPTRNPQKRRTAARRDVLDQLTDDQLLETRFCDLDLNIAGTSLEDRIEELHAELAARGIRFRPHFWLSDEWFTPDGVPGVAIPFYLAHPRLIPLERRQMFEAEGTSHDFCTKILRHETGHVIDNAYRLAVDQSFTLRIMRNAVCVILSELVEGSCDGKPIFLRRRGWNRGFL